MKKYHSPRGKRPAFRRLTYAFAAIAVLSACALVIDHDSVVTKKLGLHLDKTLVNSTKVRLGLHSHHADRKRVIAELPKGMAIQDNDQKAFVVALPKGITTKEGEDMLLIGKGHKVVGQASQEAFVTATIVDIPPK